MKKSGQMHFVPVKVMRSISCGVIVQAVNHSAVNEASCLVVGIKHQCCGRPLYGMLGTVLNYTRRERQALGAGNDSRAALTSNAEA